MIVKGVTATNASSALQKYGSTSEKRSKGLESSTNVSLTTMNAGKAVQVVGERSLKKILEMTKLAASKLGYEVGTIDTSVEATSSRIADFAIGLYGLYRQQHSEMSDEEAVNAYHELIKNAVNTGYQEALGVISGLGIDDNDILDQAQRTIDMTYEKLGKWRNAMLADAGDTTSET